MKKMLMMASALMFGASMTAFAADVKTDAELDKKVAEKFAEMDTDKNGSISWSEADAADKSQEDFAAADLNKDNMLSMAEVKAWKQMEWQQSSNTHGASTNERMREGAPTKTAH